MKRRICFRGIEISEENFEGIALKLQDELADIIKNGIDVNDYQLIMYKYIFISELKVPLLEDLGVEFAEDSFILYVIPDNLEFDLLRKLDDVFDRFKVTFMPNSFNIIKLRFRLCD